MSRREITIRAITINRQQVDKVIIDPHYRENHSDSITEDLIVELVKLLDGRIQAPEAIDGEYSYFATLLSYNKKQYRLVWLLENGALYVGVLNAYRDNRME